MVKAGRTIGKFLRLVVTSSTWRAVTRTSDELRTLPNKLIRDAGLEEDFKEIQEETKKAMPPSLDSNISKWQEDIDTWTTPPAIGKQPPETEASDDNQTTATEDRVEEEGG
jgi:uncharacterized protein YjiS (DUF1127 family)